MAYRAERLRNNNRATRKYTEGINSRMDWSKEKRTFAPDRDKFQLNITKQFAKLICRTCKKEIIFDGENFNRMEHEKEIQKFKNHHSHANS